jgi:drug/metabolite transporter (DMT)-like permease
MLAPVVAFLFVFLIYGSVPTVRELIGGLLIVSGVLLPTLMRLWRAR